MVAPMTTSTKRQTITKIVFCLPIPNATRNSMVKVSSGSTTRPAKLFTFDSDIPGGYADSIINRPMYSATCGTTEFPRALTLSTLWGTPSSTLRTRGVGASHPQMELQRGNSRRGASPSAPSASFPCRTIAGADVLENPHSCLRSRCVSSPVPLPRGLATTNTLSRLCVAPKAQADVR